MSKPPRYVRAHDGSELVPSCPGCNVGPVSAAWLKPCPGCNARVCRVCREGEGNSKTPVCGLCAPRLALGDAA